MPRAWPQMRKPPARRARFAPQFVGSPCGRRRKSKYVRFRKTGARPATEIACAENIRAVQGLQRPERGICANLKRVTSHWVVLFECSLCLPQTACHVAARQFTKFEADGGDVHECRSGRHFRSSPEGARVRKRRPRSRTIELMMSAAAAPLQENRECWLSRRLNPLIRPPEEPGGDGAGYASRLPQSWFRVRARNGGIFHVHCASPN